MNSPLVVNLFEMNCVGHISHGLWVHPDNTRHRYTDLDFWTEQARLLEHGLFDAVFLADVIGTYDGYRDGPETALREAVQIPSNDPLLVIPAMAAVTTHLGFAATFSTTYEPPFAFARRMSTLDHLTKGRVAWNVVTSYLPNAARNFGHDDEVAHDDRYAIAEEYLEVLYKLWEGSWEDDAVLRDRAGRVYTDPAKVHYIDHVGEHYRVKGPHLAEPSLQRTPVLYQAGVSDAGKAFAARHAEAVFVGGATHEIVRGHIDDLRDRAERNDRRRDDIKALVSAGIVVGRTEAEVDARLEELNRLSSAEGYLAHIGGGGPDLARYPRDTVVDDIHDDGRHGRSRSNRFRPGATVGEVLDGLTRVERGPFVAVGTPKRVADQIERWVTATGIDGINLRQFLTPGSARDFIELVVPELQRRGLYRTAYDDAPTLRERLSGAGNARLPDRHPAAQHRRGVARLPQLAAS